MTPTMNFVLAFGILSVLSAVSHAVPLPADEDEQQQPFSSSQLKKLPFSLDLEPPLPDSSSNANKPVVLPLRDSYGNPIPPAVLGVDPAGDDYGLNSPNGNTISIKKTINMQGINFPIPSYASGITEIHRPHDGLLPPFDNNRKQSQGTESFSNPSSEIPRPAIDLLPPLPETQPKDDRINEISGTLAFNTPISDTPSASLTASPSAATQSISSTKSTIPNSKPAPTLTSKGPKLKEARYTGRFGGAPGVLGEQKQVGYAVSTPPATNAPTRTTPIPTPSTTLATTTSTTPQPFKEVITRSSINEPSRIPIGVSPPSQINVAVPALAKVLLPPYEHSIQPLTDTNFFPEEPAVQEIMLPATTTTTTTSRPPTTKTPTTTTTTRRTTPTTQRTTTSTRPTTTTTRRTTTTISTTVRTTTSTSTPVPTIDLANIPFPTTIPLEVLVKGVEPKPVASGVPTVSTILLPPRFSSIAQPFQPPPRPESTSTNVPDIALPPSAPSRGRDTFLSLPFGFQNAPANESPQKTVIGKALQERFGSSLNPQQLPTFVNNLQLVAQAPSKPSQPALVSEKVAIDSPAVPLLPVIPPAPALPATSITPVALAAPLPPAVPASPVASNKPVMPVQPALVPTAGAANPATARDGSKYTGGFGGAPGVLGVQEQTGYAVKPDGSAGPAAPAEVVQTLPNAASASLGAPLAPVLPVASATPVPPVPQAVPISSNSGSKYSGGFGGPPGVLTPYDNVKKDS